MRYLTINVQFDIRMKKSASTALSKAGYTKKYSDDFKNVMIFFVQRAARINLLFVGVIIVIYMQLCLSYSLKCFAFKRF